MGLCFEEEGEDRKGSLNGQETSLAASCGWA
ncbi:unnamed protein product [Protopolystoma xenopodis]|uniref:Uncharacterized protein n=1 Tax=Protopolystoma xenopodis TaxID=117903 RepID=A0A3S5C2W3_9PLAT|nr:unnamed protein product [Protopolystoma xenopodis]